MRSDAEAASVWFPICLAPCRGGACELAEVAYHGVEGDIPVEGWFAGEPKEPFTDDVTLHLVGSTGDGATSRPQPQGSGVVGSNLLAVPDQGVCTERCQGGADGVMLGHGSLQFRKGSPLSLVGT